MEKDFVPYELALRMKNIGYDIESGDLYFYSWGNVATSNQKYETIGRFMNFWRDVDESGCFNPWVLSCPGRGDLFDHFIYAPLFQQAFRFFREKYGLHSIVSFDKFVEEENDVELDYPYFTYYYSINELWDSTKDYDRFVRGFVNVASSRDIMSYEEAELACLDKLIEIVESK